MPLTRKFHRQLARKHVKELSRPHMKMPLLFCARRHALFNHAEIRIAQQMPAVADISPRIVISFSSSNRLTHPPSPLQWDIPMLLRRIFVALALQHIQRSNQPAARFVGSNHRIHISPFSGNIRIRKLLAELMDLSGACLGQHLSFALAAQRTLSILPPASRSRSVPGRKQYSPRPSGPITAISALGHARFRSVRICLELITQ